jgi:hypothetical protein
VSINQDPGLILTLIGSCDGKPNKNVTGEQHARAPASKTNKKAGLISLENSENNMDQEIDGSSARIQHHVIAVERSVCAFTKLLVVDSGHSAHEGANHEHGIC